MDNATLAKIEFRVRELQQTIGLADIAYHSYGPNDEGKTFYSDAEYDVLKAELRDLEAMYPQFVDETSPTQRIGAPVSSNRPVVKHDFPMLSLDNLELDSIMARLRDNNLGGTLTIEPKFDGLSLSLKYSSGFLRLAALRGDGVEGEDVTANARTVFVHPATARNTDGRGDSWRSSHATFCIQAT